MKSDMNIFLVEDNDLDVELLKRGLKKQGITGALVRAKDGVDAMEQLRSAEYMQALPSPFVILLDINMPRMNGHEFLQSLRQSPELRHVRVIVFTTSDNPSDVNLAYQHFATAYVVKPNTSAELRDVLASIHGFWSVCEHPPPSLRVS